MNTQLNDPHSPKGRIVLHCHDGFMVCREKRVESHCYDSKFKYSVIVGSIDDDPVFTTWHLGQAMDLAEGKWVDGHDEQA